MFYYYFFIFGKPNKIIDVPWKWQNGYDFLKNFDTSWGTPSSSKHFSLNK